jgi:hypothetical protein
MERLFEVDKLPRCKNPVGTEHDWAPATGGIARCRKCDLATEVRDGRIGPVKGAER